MRARGHVMAVTVDGAVSVEDARRAAREISSSNLVKAMVHGRDPNWGRIMMALGKSGVELDESKIDIFINGIHIVHEGKAIPYYADAVISGMAAAEVSFRVSLNIGEASATGLGFGPDRRVCNVQFGLFDIGSQLGRVFILSKERFPNGTIVVKIGGSTLGEHDTTLKDIVSAREEGFSPVIVHGGGRIISDWMAAQNIRPVFRNGLRVTDGDSLKIVVAALGGLINKQLVAELRAFGADAVGMSGADGGMLLCRVKDPSLGYVGEVVSVNTNVISSAMESGFVPVVAPVGICSSGEDGYANSLLNVNADTAAGEIARALGAERMVFMTDVEGVLDRNRRLIPRLTVRQARRLSGSGTISGGMIPKIEACITALGNGSESHIIDGRSPGALRRSLSGESIGTRVG